MKPLCGLGGDQDKRDISGPLLKPFSSFFPVICMEIKLP